MFVLGLLVNYLRSSRATRSHRRDCGAEAKEELPVQLVDDLPFFQLDLVLSFGVKEVSSVCKAICTKRAQFGQFEVCSPNFEDVSTRWPIRKLNSEPLASLDNHDLARLHKKRTELSQNVQASLLRDNEEVSVGPTRNIERQPGNLLR